MSKRMGQERQEGLEGQEELVLTEM